MIKSELIRRIAKDNPHLYHRDVELVVNAILDEIADNLCAGNRIELRGFGTFSIRRRQERKGRNPKTGEPVNVNSKHVPFFKSGKEVRDRLNSEY